MRMKAFVQEIANDLKRVLAKPESIVHDVDDCIFLESQKFIYKLQKLLFAYEDSNCDANLSNLKLFIDLLKERESIIISTDAIYSHNIYSHANIISVKIAESLGKITNVHPFKYLFSNLKTSQFGFQDKVNSMELSDDNTYLINVLTCFEKAMENAEKNKGKNIIFEYTHSCANKNTTLSKQEKSRIIHFNNLSEDFYREVLQGSNKKRNKAYNKLRKNIGYQPNKVSYGEISVTLLKERLYGNFEDLTREKLINILLKYPPQVRGKYLKNIPIEKLHKIVFGSNYTIKTNFPIKMVTDLSLFKGKENYDSALIYSIVFLYEEELKKRPYNYNSIGGSLTGFSKKEKLTAVIVPKTFLEAGGRLKDYPAYLNEKEFDPVRPALQSWDNLSTISKQIINLGKDDYIAEIQKIHSQPRSPSTKKSWFGFSS